MDSPDYMKQEPGFHKRVWSAEEIMDRPGYKVFPGGSTENILTTPAQLKSEGIHEVILYHGTTQRDFSTGLTYQNVKTANQISSVIPAQGVYLTSNREIAERFAELTSNQNGGMPIVLKIKVPVDDIMGTPEQMGEILNNLPEVYVKTVSPEQIIKQMKIR